MSGDGARGQEVPARFDDVIFREFSTVNAATKPGSSTVVGNNGLFLSYSHIAHDCMIGDGVVISCDTKLAGHVQVGSHAVINGMTGVVQFVRIGRFAFIGGMNKVAKDVLPFCIAEGQPSEMRGVNKMGLERNGFATGQIRAIRSAYRTLLRQNLPLHEAIALLKSEAGAHPEISEMIEFAETSVLGLARSRTAVEEAEPA